MGPAAADFRSSLKKCTFATNFTVKNRINHESTGITNPQWQSM